jgi:hypothetical protein
VTGVGNVGIGTNSPYDLLHVGGGVRIGNWQGEGNGFSFFQDPNSGYLRIQYKYPYTVFADIMALSYAGKVGIGTPNPQYLLSVNGTIGTKEVVVTNTGWSDYVFRPDYRLQPLSEVKSYIQANHHLPDIPSETEVKEKGVSLGDMQSKLLAKIEELTLHMIQADERNSRLEQQNQALCERITRLESSAAPVDASAK